MRINCSPRRPLPPKINQSLLRVIKHQYGLYFQENKYAFFLLFLCLVFIITCSFLLKQPDTPSNLHKEEKLTTSINMPDVSVSKPDYIIDPLSHSTWQPYLVTPGDTLTQLLKKAELSSNTWQEIMNIGKHAQYIAQVHPGQVIHLDSQHGYLIALRHTLDPVRTLYIVRQKNGLLSSFIHEKSVETRVTYGNATIEDSLFLAGKRANIDDAILMQLADIFGCVIDFAHDIQPNDHFKVLYEEQFVENEKVGNGNILAIEFNNNGTTHQAIRYTDPHGKVGYYAPNGMSLQYTFLRTPVTFSRISSYFNARRKHPILHTIRAHKGVDYVAPTGTPVNAIADGIITYQGRKGSYGKTLIVDHGAKRSTLYAHLANYAKTIGPGKRVTQGQVIGYVGSTGLATGPHLHFEFRVNGEHRNPLNIPLPPSAPISPQQHQLFLAQSTELMDLFAYHEKIMMASNEY